MFYGYIASKDPIAQAQDADAFYDYSRKLSFDGVDKHIYNYEEISSYWYERELKNYLDKLEDGDHFAIMRSTCLSRSLTQFFEILEYLSDKEITLHVVKDDISLKIQKEIETEFLLELAQSFAKSSDSLHCSSDRLAKLQQAFLKTKFPTKIQFVSDLEDKRDLIEKSLMDGDSLMDIAKAVKCHEQIVLRYVKSNDLLQLRPKFKDRKTILRSEKSPYMNAANDCVENENE